MDDYPNARRHITRERSFFAAFLFLLLVTFLLSAPSHAPHPDHAPFDFPPPQHVQVLSSTPVAASLARAEISWNEMVSKRKALIASLGGVDRVNAFNHVHHIIWDFQPPSFPCPYFVERLGKMGEGGKWICGVDRLAQLGGTPEGKQAKRGCVVYSFGVNGDSSFEAELMRRTECEVWGYDFSVNSWAPDIAEYPELSARAHFFKYGIAGTDSAAGEVPAMYTLQSLMTQNGHDWIDVLKIDIEGYEYEVLDSILSSFPKELPFGQLQLEIHAHGDGQYGSNGLRVDGPYLLKWFQRLEDAGLRTFFTELNYPAGVYSGPYFNEYAFLNVRSSNSTLLVD